MKLFLLILILSLAKSKVQPTQKYQSQYALERYLPLTDSGISVKESDSISSSDNHNKEIKLVVFLSKVKFKSKS